MSSKSSLYKRYNRDKRHSVVETAFGAGMQYTDNPLMTGRSRLLVNLIQKDRGERTRPRGGLHRVIDPLTIESDLQNPYVHHSGQALVRDEVTGINELMRYALILSVPDDLKGQDFVPYANSVLVVEEAYDRNNSSQTQENLDGQLKLAYTTTNDLQIRHDPLNDLVKISDMWVEDPTPIGIYGSLEGNTYVMTDSGLARMDIYKNGDTYRHVLSLVESKQLSPLSAVTSGYNMLSDSPYTFANKIAGQGDVAGVTPHEPTAPDQLKLNARVGEPILFKAVYNYESGVDYKFKWEVVDLDDGQRSVQLLQSAEGSDTYRDGEEVSLVYAPTYKHFSMIVTMYEASDLTLPLSVLPLPFSSLGANDQTAKRDMVNYDFKTANNITSWKGQLVVTGVKNAEMGVFISAPFDPTYFPYPQNFISLQEPVLKTVTYMDSLMAITETSMYLIEMNVDGYKSKRVQTSLDMYPQDVDTMFSIRNMIYFKSGNQYYMVVPDLRNDQGNLQIAPITNGMTYWFDKFESESFEMLDSLYNLKNILNVDVQEVTMALRDYMCVLDSSRVRNIYKVVIRDGDLEYYIAIHCIYDTVFRSWTLETYQTSEVGMFPFKTLATGYMQYFNLYKSGSKYNIEWLEVREDEPLDDYYLDNDEEPIFHNQQLLDTGKRNMDSELKKRFRHVIVEFNNLSDERIPVAHMFMIDDMERSDLYEYTVRHITDPDDPNYGLIYVERSFIMANQIQGATKLNEWELNFSQFPDVTVVKVHIDVSGKGYFARLKLLFKEPRLYEINNINWVWRDMNAR